MHLRRDHLEQLLVLCWPRRVLMSLNLFKLKHNLFKQILLERMKMLSLIQLSPKQRHSKNRLRKPQVKLPIQIQIPRNYRLEKMMSQNQRRDLELPHLNQSLDLRTDQQVLRELVQEGYHQDQLDLLQEQGVLLCQESPQRNPQSQRVHSSCLSYFPDSLPTRSIQLTNTRTASLRSPLILIKQFA